MTWRESLRDIEATLGANANKLYAMGLRHAVHRSTFADANDSREWRIWSDLAAVLIRHARKLKLYRDEGLGLDLTNTVYALDSTTIDLCLSRFDWAPFRKTKVGVKMHTLLDLRDVIPAFIHISDGKMGDVNVLDFLPVEAGAFYVMDRGYLDFTRLYALHQVGAFFVTRAKRNMDARRVYSSATDRTAGVICDQAIAMKGFYVPKAYPERLRRIRFKDPESGKTLIFLTKQYDAAAADHRRAVQESLAGGTVLQVDQAAPAHQGIPRHERERGEDANLVRRVYLGVNRSRTLPISDQRESRVRLAALRKMALSLENIFSIGLRSGEYGGK
ncbi:uncharacterized protein DUF4372 [Paralcaligenes ureilyticus]|uniref:Uncharacterized protein DUF4372 n=1 Tax=Paralcaligenes ureilyticus TaxID=627131 RepID=A0A4R3M8C7_9BURK|nr:uncharacterized protein DUF4372 [Paralcaligenes ureilyticus]